MSELGGTELSATLRRIERAAGALATASVARMDETLPWFRELPADQRSWVMLVAQAGARSLVQWLRQGGGTADSTQEVSDEVFATAPQALARSISLQQTVALIKVTIDVVEEQVSHLAAKGEEQQLREAVLRFSREIAFAAARVYARAAESRGSWDARLQALLVDALLRGDSPDVLASRAAALGWTDAPGLSYLDRPNVAVLRTLSKAWGLAGLRIGWLVAEPTVAAAVRKVVTPFSTSMAAQAGALAALSQADEVERRCALVVAERERVTEALRKLLPDVPSSQANFVWLPLGDRAVEFGRACEARGVIVRPFPGDGVRVTIGTPEENDAFLAAAESALA